MEASEPPLEETEYEEAVRKFKSFAQGFEERLKTSEFSGYLASTVLQAANTGSPKIEFVGVGSAGIVIKIEGYRRPDIVIKIVFTGKGVFRPQVVKWESLIGAWFTSGMPDSYSGPSIPAERSGTVLSKSRATKLLNVLGHERAAYLDEHQALEIANALNTMKRAGTLIGYEPEIDSDLFHKIYKRIDKAPRGQRGPYGVVFEVEEADMALDEFLGRKRSYGSLARAIQTATIQILMTYDELNSRYTWVHGDLGPSNVFVAGVSAPTPQELIYEGSGDHVLRIVEDSDKRQFILFFIGDVGFSFFEGREFLEIRGVKTPGQWHSLLSGQSFAADLHHFAIDSIYDVVISIVALWDEKKVPTSAEQTSVIDSLHMLSSLMFRDEDLADGLFAWIQKEGKMVNYKNRIREIRESVEAIHTIETGVLSFASVYGTSADPAVNIMDFRYLPDEAVVDGIRRRDFSDLWAHRSFDPYRLEIVKDTL